MRTELSLSGHPRPATESQDIWNDYPFGDSAATSLLSSHGYIIGAWQCPVQQSSYEAASISTWQSQGGSPLFRSRILNLGRDR